MDEEQLCRLTDERYLLERFGVYRGSRARALGVVQRADHGPHGRSVFPGVHALRPGPPDADARRAAAVLFAGPPAVLTGLAGLQHEGEWTGSVEPLEVLVPADQRTRRQPGLLVRRTRVLTGRQVRGLAVATPGRLLVDVARAHGHRRAVAVAARLVQRRLVSREALLVEVLAYPRLAGASTARGALRALGLLDSRSEVDVVAVLRSLGLPPDAVQVVLAAHGVPLTRVDLWWDRGLAGFVDGYPHLDLAVQERDRDLRLRLEGWGVVVRACSPSAARQPQGLVRALRQGLAQARGGFRREGDRVELVPGCLGPGCVCDELV